eukprot:gene9579-7505_t
MRLITMGLTLLAMLSNRTLVYPEPPCAAAWMLKNHNTSGCDASMALEPVTLELMPYAALDDPAAGASSTKSVRFASTFTLHGGCVGGGQNYYTGMLNVEFERWLLHDCPSGTAKEPGPTNSAFLRGHSIIPKRPGPKANAFSNISTLATTNTAKEPGSTSSAFLRGHSIVIPKKEDEPADWSVGEVLMPKKEDEPADWSMGEVLMPKKEDEPADWSVGEVVMPKKEDEPADWSVGEVLVKLPIAEAFMELKRLDAAPLVFVAHPVVVDFLTNMGQSEL